MDPKITIIRRSLFFMLIGKTVVKQRQKSMKEMHVTSFLFSLKSEAHEMRSSSTRMHGSCMKAHIL